MVNPQARHIQLEGHFLSHAPPYRLHRQAESSPGLTLAGTFCSVAYQSSGNSAGL